MKRHNNFPKGLGGILTKLSTPVLNKRGFAANRIIQDWPHIVGTSLAGVTTPQKITYTKKGKTKGTLHIEVSEPAAATELLYMQSVIIEKIALYFGNRNIGAIKIVQTPAKSALLKNKKDQKKISKPLTKQQSQKIETHVSTIANEGLQATLRSLGTHILQRKDVS